MTRILSIAFASSLLLSLGCGETETTPEATRIRVTLENVADQDTHALSDGSSLTVALAPGLYAISDDGELLYTVGGDASAGLERLAELGDPLTLETSIAPDALDQGIIGDVDNPDYRESPVLPGQVANFVVEVQEGQLLEVAMMLGVSNDTILSAPGGVDLLEALGDADTAEITSSFAWVDVGTEVDEPIGEGANQPSSDSSIDAGDDEDTTVQLVTDPAAENLPAHSDVVKITLTRL